MAELKPNPWKPDWVGAYTGPHPHLKLVKGRRMTDEEREKLCAELRNADLPDQPMCDEAADEIERLAEQSQFWGNERDIEFNRRVKAEQALAQSDAEPVAWQWRLPGQEWPELSCGEAHAKYMRERGAEIRPVYAAPPRPDASGLIEAAELAEEEAKKWGTPVAIVLMKFASDLRSRAADRGAG